jgi:hypothetical protein
VNHARRNAVRRGGHPQLSTGTQELHLLFDRCARCRAVKQQPRWSGGKGTGQPNVPARPRCKTESQLHQPRGASPETALHPLNDEACRKLI